MSGDGPAIAVAKRVLRSAVLLRRDARPADRRRADDHARVEVIQRHWGRTPLPIVAAYLSSGSEPGTREVIGWLAASGVRLLLPVLTDGGQALLTAPAWAPYDGPDALRVGRRSILEPTTAVLPASALGQVGLVICAGLAADLRGQRLGRGGGWYDRALQHAQPDASIVVLLNDDEVLESVPADGWDRRVHAIATPSRLITCDPPA